MTWIDTAACRSRAFCRACRTEPEFRASLLRAGKVDVQDFACPHGFTAAHLPIRGPGDLIERAVKPIAKLLKLPCLEKDGSLKPDSPCAKRRDRINALTRP